MPDLNNEMVSLGALVAARKPVMLVALQAGAITAQGITSAIPAQATTRWRNCKRQRSPASATLLPGKRWRHGSKS
jgi:hypothetical protein